MVIREVPAKHQALLEQLKSCDLSGISIEPSGQWLRFDFTSGIGGPSVVVTLFNPTFFKFSRDFDDEGHSVVGEASLIPLKDGGKEAFTSLGYDLRNECGTVATYSSRSLFHFHLDGGICIDAVCEAYEMLQEIKE